ncbi:MULTISPECIES: hypothetical protein [Natrialba]|uniref:V-ATPase proteolipid subunit C-like domain-containing protein n=1 Tax=Natrialba swarupiae TaxID=2448032 RepID=A0A5D5AN42_9EURY|nr:MULTISPECIES: hypothetical protein [Natrialba]MWV38799.1 hypothetical protein [Natrialba sp. INN-245]TYT62317.1 hypothetical protein FYC77_08835 [Natrialba swarupiae]
MIENAPELADIALQAAEAAETNESDVAVAENYAEAAAAISVGLAALASGYAERGIGAAAVGAIAEDDDMFVPGIVMTVLPETLVIFAIVVIFLVG